MKSTEIKKIFKSLGINVSVRTVKCKNPFTQIWIPYEGFKPTGSFPNYVRKAALLVYYNVPDLSTLNVLNQDDINYGNIRPESISLDVKDHERFFMLVLEYYKLYLAEQRC